VTYEEAMVIVDDGGIVAQESQWVMTAAGFAWGPWVSRERRWSADDLQRMKERDALWTAENPLPQIEASGEYYRAIHTLCESWEIEESEKWRNSVGWIDVTDRFENGTPKGYFEFMHGGN
jgi:hypothetical protein